MISHDIFSDGSIQCKNSCSRLFVIVNGRFLTRKPTGVDRVAEEILRSINQMITEGAEETKGLTIRVVKPWNSMRSLNLRFIEEERRGFLAGHFWEQIELPFLSTGRWLFNPCNTGPVLHRKSFTIIHDAQIYLVPAAYSRAFRSFYRALLPVLGRTARVLSTVSGFSLRQLERYGAFPHRKALVIPNGCDHLDRVVADSSSLCRWNLQDTPFFLVIGSLSPHKNLKIVLEANKKRRDLDKRPLVVAGERRSRVFSTEDLADADGAIFLGRVTDEELKALYQKATALLFPSIVEGFGLPPLEAMRCGCPVIASTAEAVAEVCSDAVIYADPAKVEDWVKAMDTLSADGQLRQELAARGRARAARYTWRATATRVLDLMRSSERVDREQSRRVRSNNAEVV